MHPPVGPGVGPGALPRLRPTFAHSWLALAPCSQWKRCACRMPVRFDRQARIHPSRPRRPIVFIDDATGCLLALRFATTETTEACMTTLRDYLDAHGRPVALYSDKHRISRRCQKEMPNKHRISRRISAQVDAKERCQGDAPGRHQRHRGRGSMCAMPWVRPCVLCRGFVRVCCAVGPCMRYAVGPCAPIFFRHSVQFQLLVSPAASNQSRISCSCGSP